MNHSLVEIGNGDYRVFVQPCSVEAVAEHGRGAKLHMQSGHAFVVNEPVAAVVKKLHGEKPPLPAHALRSKGH